MKVMGGSAETPLSALRPYRVGVPSSGALNMNTSPHLIICYLLKSERGGLGVIVSQSIS